MVLTGSTRRHMLAVACGLVSVPVLYVGYRLLPLPLKRIASVAVLPHGRAGDRAKAGGLLEELTMLSRQRYVSPVNFALVYAGLGDADSTFQWMEKAYQTRSAGVRELASMCFDSVRSDPRYPDLMKRVGLPV